MRVGLSLDWIVSLQDPNIPTTTVKFGPLVFSGVPLDWQNELYNGNVFTWAIAKIWVYNPSSSYQYWSQNRDGYTDNWPPSGTFGDLSNAQFSLSVNALQTSERYVREDYSITNGIGIASPQMYSNTVMGSAGVEREYVDGQPSYYKWCSLRHRQIYVFHGNILIDFVNNGGAVSFDVGDVSSFSKTMTATYPTNRTVYDVYEDAEGGFYISGNVTSVISKYDIGIEDNSPLPAYQFRVVSTSYNASLNRTKLVLNVTYISTTPPFKMVFIPMTNTVVQLDGVSINGDGVGTDERTTTVNRLSAGVNFTTGDLQPDLLGDATAPITNHSIDYSIELTHNLRFFVVGEETELASLRSSILALNGNTNEALYPIDISSYGNTWAELVLLADEDGIVNIIGAAHTQRTQDNIPGPAVPNFFDQMFPNPDYDNGPETSGSILYRDSGNTSQPTDFWHNMKQNTEATPDYLINQIPTTVDGTKATHDTGIHYKIKVTPVPVI